MSVLFWSLIFFVVPLLSDAKVIKAAPTQVSVKAAAPAPDSVVPLSFDDPVFKNAVSTAAPVNLKPNQTVSNLSLVDNSGQASVLFQGDGTINFVRMNTREGPRCTSGKMNLNWVWVTVYPEQQDHADGFQCYSPGSTGVVTVKNTTFYPTKGSHTAYFSADDWRGEHYFENVLFWGDGTSQFGLRIPADGGSAVHLKNVFFVKNAVGTPFLFDVVNGKQIPILQWDNVRWVTIVNGKMVMGDLIPKPY